VKSVLLLFEIPSSCLTRYRIENYSILLASCAPVARLFFRAFVDSRRDGRLAGYWSKSPSNNGENSDHSNDMELKRRRKDQWMDSATMSNWDEENPMPNWVNNERSESRVSKAQHPENPGDGVTVKTDIIVQVDDGRSTSSGGARLLPDGGEPSHGNEYRRSG